MVQRNDATPYAGPRAGHGRNMGGPAFTPAGDIETALQGAIFPAEKLDLVDIARDNDADEAFIERLSGLSQETYNSIDDFRAAFGEGMDNYGVLKGSVIDDDDDIEDAHAFTDFMEEDDR